jgi:hypothetical protein
MGRCIGQVWGRKSKPEECEMFTYIYISSILFARASDYEQRNVVVHEAAHAVEYLRIGKAHEEKAHGFDWETKVLRTGYEPEEFHRVDTTGVEKSGGPLTMPAPVI